MRTRDGKNLDLGWKKVGSGIRDKHPGSVTLMRMVLTFTTFCFILTDLFIFKIYSYYHQTKSLITLKTPG